MAKKATKRNQAAKKGKITDKRAAPRRVGPVNVPLHKIVHFVRLLQRRKRAAKFVAHAKDEGASLTLPGASRIAIHDFLDKHGMLGDACPTPDPFDCPKD